MSEVEREDAMKNRWLNRYSLGGFVFGMLLTAIVMVGVYAVLNTGGNSPLAATGEVATADASGLLSGSPTDVPDGPVTLYMYPEVTNKMSLNGDSFVQNWAPLAGELILTAFDYPVKNLYVCDGRSLPRSADIGLYATLTHGDTDTFSLPKLPLADGNGVPLTYRIAGNAHFPMREYSDDPAATAAGIKYYAAPALPDSRDIAYIGGIYLISGLAAEGNRFLVPCEGQTLQKRDNEALFALIGTRFGGDGKTNFRVPDLSDLKPPVDGARYYIATGGIFLSQDF